MYEYHRLGLDEMYEGPNKGRAAILKSIDYLVKVKDGWPNLYILQLMMEAKGDAAWQPVNRDRVVSQALQAYAIMTTSAARGAVRDISQLSHNNK